jgi:hypothetical protein
MIFHNFDLGYFTYCKYASISPGSSGLSHLPTKFLHSIWLISNNSFLSGYLISLRASTKAVQSSFSISAI